MAEIMSNQMDVMVNEIEGLLNDLYSGPNRDQNSRFDKANKVLIDLQTSKEAWMFCWMLMNKEKPVNVQYYGASGLYIKLTKYNSELNPESYQQIWMKNIEHLVSYMGHSEFNIITTKLISCLAVCIVQNIDTNWKTALQDMVNIFHPEKLPQIPPTRVIQVLLEILSVIPEEVKKPYNDRSKKISARAELKKHAESVLQFVHKVLSEENISDDITKTCLKCFSHWTVDLDALVLGEHHSSIMAQALNCVRNENTCHEAVDSIIHIYSTPYMIKQPKLILQLIVQATTTLTDVIDQAIKETNHDFLRDLYILFINIGESHDRLILDYWMDKTLSTEVVIAFFNIILKCSSTPTYFGYDEHLSDLPFNFWIIFQDDLMASGESDVQIYRTVFKDIFHSLIEVYLFKLQYPPDEIYLHSWNDSDRETFRCYRQDIADTYVSSFGILNTTLLDILSNHLKKALWQTSNAPTEFSNLRYLEAVIYAFSSLSEDMSNTENNIMPQIFMSFQVLPFEFLNDARFLSTINGFLSNSAEWLHHNTDYLVCGLNIISNSLKSTDQSVKLSATMALKMIVTECQLQLKPFAQPIIMICEEYLKGDHLQYKEKARLMHALGSVLSIMPMEIIMQTIDRILIPILTEMEKILAIPKENNPDTQIHVNGVLLMLSNLFGKLDVQMVDPTLVYSLEAPIDHSLIQKNPKPLLLIFEKVLPLFNVIVMNYSNDEEIAENLCECIKKSVATLLDDIKPLVGNILQLLHHLYFTSLSIPAIKVFRHLFTCFHKEQSILPYLQEYFYSVAKLTMEAFEKDFREHTILAQNFYEEYARALKNATVIFLNPKLDLMKIFEWAVSGILLPEKSTIHQCSVFITEFLTQGRNSENYEPFQKVINERFEVLVTKVFIVIGGSQGSPSYAVDYMSDIILVLNKKYSDNFNRALAAIVEANGFPTRNVTREQKSLFVRSISSLKYNASKRKLSDVITEFSSRCRGLHH